MAKLQLKAKRRRFEFGYEFEDGTVATFEYLAPTTSQIDRLITPQSQTEALKAGRDVLVECLVGDADEVEKLIQEQTESTNIYEFRETLDIELGKLKKKG